MRRKLLISILVMMFILAGCAKETLPVKGSNDVTTKNIDIETTKESITQQPTTKVEETTKIEEYEPVKLMFTGDVCISDILYNNYVKSGVSGILSDRVFEEFKTASLTIIDHEFTCTDVDDKNKVDYQLFTFKSPTNREYILKEMHVDIANLANNHILDYGYEGLMQTMNTLKSLGIDYVGAGNNLGEAKSAVIKEVNGKKIAILSASRVVPIVEWYATDTRAGVMTTYETTDRYTMILEEIKRLKEEEKCDFVVVAPHFGTEKTNVLEDYQKVVAHGYIDAGADLVMASHAHVLQGIEYYNGKPIYYNMGNFLFGSYYTDTMLVNIEINEDNTCKTKVLPCSSKMFYTSEKTGDELISAYRFLENISINIEIDKDGYVTQKE